MSRPALAALALALAVSACSSVVRRTVSPDEAGLLDGRSPYLKAHFADGRLFVLGQWSVDDDARVVTGTGHLYGPGREVMETGQFEIGVDSVAIFETNVREVSSVIAPIVIMTGISLSVTLACALNWKSCFGSCPTFYVDDGGRESLRAEGFSASIAPWLEATDVDALRIDRPGGARVELRMTNEALETHVVRHADLLALPVEAGEWAVKDAVGTFYRVRAQIPPARCAAPEGDVTGPVRAFDGVERVSEADSTDLATPEVVEVTFDEVPAGEHGLIIGARQTLLTTYLLYETLSNIGAGIGAWMAAASARGPDPDVGDALGGIEVLVRAGDGWRVVGTVGEHGPIAADTWVVPLPAGAGPPATLRLRMARGNWRLDYVALAALSGPVTPVRVVPDEVRRESRRDDGVLAALWDPREVITTMPGDELILRYTLPGDHARYALFLESRGYYLEWMRDEWLVESDHARALEMLYRTGHALRRVAPEFKKVEDTMEASFWGSRYARPQ